MILISENGPKYSKVDNTVKWSRIKQKVLTSENFTDKNVMLFMNKTKWVQA